ncbi:MAG: type II toxin-antitoxin system RelE/ParE family toxin [Chlorobiales bacterium]|jgi:mRNA interferase RelE/StbE|nr:type II toxin-antitoxin system RelE/ParE family toxin [Chlorobiales bacterium]
MAYTVQTSERARKDIVDLSESMKDRIKTAIYALAESPRPHGSKKLSGREGHRIRVGDYRILYDIADKIKVVSVMRVRHRREVYRD